MIPSCSCLCYTSYSARSNMHKMSVCLLGQICDGHFKLRIRIRAVPLSRLVRYSFFLTYAVGEGTGLGMFCHLSSGLKTTSNSITPRRKCCLDPAISHTKSRYMVKQAGQTPSPDLVRLVSNCSIHICDNHGLSIMGHRGARRLAGMREQAQPRRGTCPATRTIVLASRSFVEASFPVSKTTPIRPTGAEVGDRHTICETPLARRKGDKSPIISSISRAYFHRTFTTAEWGY